MVQIDMKMAEDKMQLSTLYRLSIQTVYQHYINDNTSFAMKYLPDPVNYDLIRQVSIILFNILFVWILHNIR